MAYSHQHVVGILRGDTTYKIGADAAVFHAPACAYDVSAPLVMNQSAFFVPHAGWPRSHFTFLVLHLHRRQFAQLIEYDYQDVRFAADRHRTLPLSRGATLRALSVLPAGTLITPGMRVRGVLGELCGAIRARDLVLHRDVLRWRRTHGDSIGAWADGACRCLRSSSDRDVEGLGALCTISILPQAP